MRYPLLIVALSIFGMGSLTSWAQSAEALPAKMEPERQASLQQFLKTYLRDPYYDYKETQYIAASTELTDHTLGMIVFLADQKSCGSSGCTILILVRDREGYRVVTSIPAAWPPIRILKTKTNGWHDIGVWVEGGGIRPGYEALLSFNGKTYPKNPTVPPARRVERAKGETLIFRNQKATPLY